MIADNGPDRSAGIHDFCRSKIGRESGKDAASRHWQLHVTKIEERVTAEKNVVALYCCNGASGIDGDVALHQNHSGHIARRELGVVGTRGGSAALRCDKAQAAQLI